jgi:hypothetical protein
MARAGVLHPTGSALAALAFRLLAEGVKLKSLEPILPQARELKGL